MLSRTHPAYEFRRGQLQMAQAVELALAEKRHLIVEAVRGGIDELEHYRAIAAWEKTTQTGDRAELASLPEASALWHKLDARADTCLGQKCSSWERCFITEMHRRAMESDIIIVNHHLFFADLAIKQQAEDGDDAGILPDAGTVIFDEAHELEDVASSYFGITVSNARVEELCRDVEASLQRNHLLSASVSGALKSLRERAMFFFALLPQGEGRFAFENRREFLEENGDEFLAIQHSLGRIGSELENLPSKPEEIFNFVRRAGELQVQLGFLMESDDRNTVFWIERRRGGRDKSNVFLQATPIDVAPILKTCLFDRLECAVLTSATLAVGGGFDYMRRRLGLEQTRELVLASHFDYENQAMFYVPPDLPDPRTPQFAAKAADCIRRLLEITRGRAFVLFTSYAQMNEIYQRLLGELEFPMLLQGDAPKTALLEEFRLTPNAVLFATSSFWQGVDVQGEQLSC